MYSTILIHQALKTVAALVIIALGVYQLVNYYYMPVLLRGGGMLVGAVSDMVIGMLLLFSSVEIIVPVFAYIFGLLLVTFGVNRVTFVNRLYFFGIFDYSWVMTNGVMDMLAAAAFLITLLISIVMPNTTLAGYLAVDGITLLVEVVTMKNMKIGDTQERIGATAYKT